MTDKEHVKNMFHNIYCISKKPKHVKKKFEKSLKKRGWNHIKYFYGNDDLHVLDLQKMILKTLSTHVILCREYCEFVGDPMITRPPKDWDFLYFGGHVEQITDHSNAEWKKGYFSEAFFVAINKRVFKDLVQHIDKNKHRTFDHILLDFQKIVKATSYCHNPQLVSMNSEQTSLVNLDETPERIEFIKKAEKEDKRNNLFLLTVPNKKSAGKLTYNENIFTCLSYNFIKNTYDKDKKFWIVVLPDEAREGHRKIKEELEKIKKEFGTVIILNFLEHEMKRQHKENDEVHIRYPETEAEYYNWVLDQLCYIEKNLGFNVPLLKGDDNLIVHFSNGHYYAHDYLQICNDSMNRNPELQIIGTTKTVVYQIDNNESRYFEPLDIHQHKVIMNHNFIVYKPAIFKERKFFDQHFGNPMLTFLKERFDLAGLYQKEDYDRIGFRFVGKTNFDNLEKGAPNINTFFKSIFDRNFFECIVKTY